MKDSVFRDMLVLELASVLAGPSVGQFFAELGAKVIKIENAITHGDVTRSWKLPSESPDTDTPAYFCAANWGKSSMALDLRQAQDLQQLYALTKEAAIVIASYKPGDAEKLKVDFATLQAINPALIYGHITGYGEQDSRAGYDAVVQAESGFMYLNGEPGGPPVKMPVALMDVLTAHQLKEGLLVAMLQRERTGQGQLVQVSILDSGIAALANQATNYLVAGHEPQRMGSEHPNIVPYGSVYTTKDRKQLVLAIGDDRQFKKLCSALGKPELAELTAFKTNHSRVRNRQEVNHALSDLISHQDRAPLLQLLHDLHVPAGAVNSIPEVFRLPQAQEMLLRQQDTPGGVRQVAFRIAGQELPALSPPPAYDKHS
ncbi:CaiB/BaiF CoA transferase family protein [Pontibacter sp. MBLB2868]|uniref:CaiB/BaiF CoA transferase family protein n=1 Tax=Pontibacter sp. MBLB2868 TaxID=3451555 RepID=UPI003F74C95C